jgi:SAM-dependent methyltransferase
MAVQIDQDWVAPYDTIAEEYYDLDLHKTSRNFDSATKAAFADTAIRNRLPKDGLLLDVGAGRGRAHEFLGIEPNRIIQLDESARMLALQPREDCLLRVKHRAEFLPFVHSQFSCIAAFLCDGYIGLDFLSEAFRVLRSSGILIGTLPAKAWGTPLREEINCDLSLTRFVTMREETVFCPSTLLSNDELFAMLRCVGFEAAGIEITSLTLPRDATPISKDIVRPAAKLGVEVHELPILQFFIARR